MDADGPISIANRKHAKNGHAVPLQTERALFALHIRQQGKAWYAGVQSSHPLTPFDSSKRAD